MAGGDPRCTDDPVQRALDHAFALRTCHISVLSFDRAPWDDQAVPETWMSGDADLPSNGAWLTRGLTPQSLQRLDRLLDGALARAEDPQPMMMVKVFDDDVVYSYGRRWAKWQAGPYEHPLWPLGLLRTARPIWLSVREDTATGTVYRCVLAGEISERHLIKAKRRQPRLFEARAHLGNAAGPLGRLDWGLAGPRPDQWSLWRRLELSEHGKTVAPIDPSSGPPR